MVEVEALLARNQHKHRARFLKLLMLGGHEIHHSGELSGKLFQVFCILWQCRQCKITSNWHPILFLFCEQYLL